MDSLFAPFGVRVEASNSLVQAAFSAFLIVGIVSFAAPIVSTVRVLLSLFILPGKAVCAPLIMYMYFKLMKFDSSPNLVPGAHGLSLPVLLMVLAKSSLSHLQLRVTTLSSFPELKPSLISSLQTSRLSMVPRPP